MSLDTIAYGIGYAVLIAGGFYFALTIVAWIWEKALTYSSRMFGECSSTWWDVLREMHRQKKLRWQKEKL